MVPVGHKQLAEHRDPFRAELVEAPARRGNDGLVLACDSRIPGRVAGSVPVDLYGVNYRASAQKPVVVASASASSNYAALRWPLIHHVATWAWTEPICACPPGPGAHDRCRWVWDPSARARAAGLRRLDG